MGKNPDHHTTAKNRTRVIKKKNFRETLDYTYAKIELALTTALENFKLKFRPQNQPQSIRILYACPVGQYSKQFLPKIIEKFNSLSHIKTHFLLFDYESTDFSEAIYSDCEILRGPGLKWELIRKHVTPQYCEPYDLIFFWDDDIDIENFSLTNFTDIFFRNHLQLAQPALTDDSYISHWITLQNKRYKIGRYSDFVEIMVPVFTQKAWASIYPYLNENVYWGWGIDDLARSLCRYTHMGIIDCEVVKHTRPVGDNHKAGFAELALFLPRFKKMRQALKIEYGQLK